MDLAPSEYQCRTAVPEPEGTAGAMYEGDSRIRNLPRSALAPELSRRLDDQEDAAHTGVIRGETAAVGIDGQGSTEPDAPVTDERATLASLCDKVAETREPYVIERRNGENVALISEAELNSLLETAHLLRSPKNARRLASALERASGGLPAPSSLKKLRQSLGLEDE